MNKKLKEKIMEAFSSVLPITLIVLVLSITIVPMEISTIVMFLVGAVLLIVGMGLFTLGADMAMMPMGEGIGVQMTKFKKLGLIVLISFIMGFVITIAEPDLTVLANQVPSIPDRALILTVAVGVGVFLVFAVIRVLFRVSLSRMLIVFYGLIFLVSAFVPNAFVGVSFDSGGVTTGPITVPFIMAMGLGIASVRSDKDAQSDSFGFVALCSVGPILAVLILGICYNPTDASYTPVTVPEVGMMRDVVGQFAIQLPHYLKEVLIAIVPIVVVFIIFQLFSRRFKKRQLARISVGFIYTLVGLMLFLTGVNVGFIPVGHIIGSQLAASTYKWLLIPVGMLIGYYVVKAEPAVHVLNKQVEEVSGGAIPQSTMRICLSIGVAASLGMSMLRVLTGISIYWFLIPGYAIALILTFFVPKIFTGIAFDSGGVVTGPMTSTFILPLAMGACEAAGGNVLTDAFGAVAMVAMTPLIVIQILGLVYGRRIKAAEAADNIAMDSEDDIIDFDDVEGSGELQGVQDWEDDYGQNKS